MLGAVGASGALIAVAVCALLIFSAVVAERGWPGMAASLAPAPLLLPSSASPGSTASVPRVQVGSAPAPHGGRSLSPVKVVAGGSALASGRGGGRSVSGAPQASTIGGAPPVTPGPRSGSGSGPAGDIAPSVVGIPTPTPRSPTSPAGPSFGGQTPGGQGGPPAGAPPPGPASPLATVVDQTGRGAAGAVSTFSPAGAGAVVTITKTVVAALPHGAVPLIGVTDVVASREPVPAAQASRDTGA